MSCCAVVPSAAASTGLHQPGSFRRVSAAQRRNGGASCASGVSAVAVGDKGITAGGSAAYRYSTRLRGGMETTAAAGATWWERSLRQVARSTTRGGNVAVSAQASKNVDEGNGGKGFLTGLLIGGAVCGIAGFLFAPQLSRTLLKGREGLREGLGLLDDEEDSLETTRQNLNDKIAQLNAAIDNFSAEADRGVEDKLTQLNRDMDNIEKNNSGDVVPPGQQPGMTPNTSEATN